MRSLASPGLFRLALAFLVFLHHVTRLDLGGAAVYMFFVLSGYWIFSIWTQRYATVTAPYRTFVVARAWRLLPVFLLCTAGAWAILYWQGSIPRNVDSWLHQLASNLFLVGYSSLHFLPLVPAWSLDIEMQFYLIAPLLIMLAVRSSQGALLVGVLISLAAHVMQDTMTVGPFLVFFAIGVAAGSSQWRPGGTLAGSALTFATASVVLCLAGPFRGVLLGGAHRVPLIAFNDLASVILALAMVPWVIYTTRQESSRLDRMFGDLSYIVYLVHWPILEIIKPGVGSPMQRAISTGAALIGTLIAAWLIWKLFDHPINALRSAWVNERRAKWSPGERAEGEASDLGSVFDIQPH